MELILKAKALFISEQRNFKVYYNKKIKDSLFKVKDFIYFSSKNLRYYRRYRKLNIKYSKIFKVLQISFRKLTYKVKLPYNYYIYKIFPIALLELYKVREGDNPYKYDLPELAIIIYIKLRKSLIIKVVNALVTIQYVRSGIAQIIKYKYLYITLIIVPYFIIRIEATEKGKVEIVK